MKLIMTDNVFHHQNEHPGPRDLQPGLEETRKKMEEMKLPDLHIPAHDSPVYISIPFHKSKLYTRENIHYTKISIYDL